MSPIIPLGVTMIVKSVQIKQYRCIQEETLSCGALTVLVGANGTGKSSFLQALDLFYAPKPSLDDEDLCHHRDGDVVEITVTYTHLSGEAQAQFAKYVQGSDLAITRVLKFIDGRTEATYHGSRLQCIAFGPVRDARLVADTRALYSALRQQAPYPELPAASTKADIIAALDQWEDSHPDACQRIADDGQFFGFTGVGAGYLGRYTKFLLVPAVRDAAADGEDGKNSLFAELIDLVARKALAGNPEIAALNTDVTERYREIVVGAQGQELSRVGDELTRALAEFAPATEVTLTWAAIPAIQLSSPRAVVKVGEHGYGSSIERKGHGLQRAFIMTMLQYLERVRNAVRPPLDDGAIQAVPDLIIGIEEPELYQHPDRQRHIASVLLRLAGVAPDPESPSTQILYTTHSPHFVGLDRFDDIRLARKVTVGSNTIPTTQLKSVSLELIAQQLAAATNAANPAAFTGHSLRGRLAPLMTPWMNEGFFGEAVVLVEGEQDRAALLAAARLAGHDLESMGIAVIPCLSKNNLDRPALIFRSFGIPTYLVWDSDQSQGQPKANRALLRILGKTEEDYPEFIEADAACFREKIEATIWQELTPEVLEPLFAAARDEFELKNDDIMKNPNVMARILADAAAQGHRSTSLDAIIARIVALHPISA
jgi:putative ATP-dependent endonuclease of OLD family